MRVIKLDSIDSTNTYCKSLIRQSKSQDNFPFAVISREQSAGRGRYSKNFYSPKDTGIYLSYTFEGSYEKNDLLKITTVIASITHKVLSKFSKKPLSIKWINDIYKDKKKIAGILTEYVENQNDKSKYYIIIGIGINVFPNSIPAELEDIMGFLCEDNNNDNLTEMISNELIESIYNCFDGNTTTYFNELIEYYKIHCFDLPTNNNL